MLHTPVLSLPETKTTYADASNKEIKLIHKINSNSIIASLNYNDYENINANNNQNLAA